MTEQPPLDPWAELRAEIAVARAAVAEYDDQERIDEETAEVLQADALAGRLGDDMQELAHRVDARETTWEQIFRDPERYGPLLSDHVERMARQNAADIAVALQEDPEVDDLGPPSGPAADAGQR